MIYYFAYGSNMDEVQMKERCPDSVLVGKVVLRDYKLAFTIFSPRRKCGCADIIKSVGDEVWGLLYLLTEADLKELDKHERHPKKYKRFTTTVADSNGKPFEAEAYQVVNKQSEYQTPSRDYMDRIIVASKKFDFPEKYGNYISEFKILE